ncbi:MAG: hypothetical protein R3344_12885, partial [Acidobacteriota bacterium]|nr:hypothetical protein [Acidobacteriota bacterium]
MLDDILSNVVGSLRGIRAMVLVDRDGMLVSMAGDAGDGSLELLAASYTDIARKLTAIHEETGLDGPGEIVTTMGSAGAVLHHRVTPDYAMIALLDADATLGRVRFELRKAAARLFD